MLSLENTRTYWKCKESINSNLKKTTLLHVHNTWFIKLRPRQTSPREFENGVSTLKMHQMFCVHDYTGGIWKKNRLRKASFSKCFRSKLKCNAGVFKFLRFEESFRKAPFSWRIRRGLDGAKSLDKDDILTSDVWGKRAIARGRPKPKAATQTSAWTGRWSLGRDIKNFVLCWKNQELLNAEGKFWNIVLVLNGQNDSVTLGAPSEAFRGLAKIDDCFRMAP